MNLAEAVLLIVNPDRAGGDRMGHVLERAGYRVLCAGTTAEGRRAVERYGAPDLVMLTLPADGLTLPVLRRELCLGDSVPAIAIVNRDHQDDAHAVDDGADDFLVCPTTDEEIVARVRRVLRRSADNASRRIPVDKVLLAEERDQWPAGWLVPPGLSERETALWALLRHHEERVLSAAFLLNQVWPHETVSEGTLRVTIHRLRHKLQLTSGGAARILSVRGRGYLYTCLPTPTAALLPATPPGSVA